MSGSLSTAMETRSRPSGDRAKRTKRSPVWLTTIATVVFLVSLNLAFGLCFPEVVDLTSRGFHTLSPQTESLLGTIDQPFEVILLCATELKSTSEREFAQAAVMLRELLERYSQVTPMIVVHDADPQTSAEGRQLLQRYPDVSPVRAHPHERSAGRRT